MLQIKNISYGFNSTLPQPYSLDANVFEDGKTLVNVSEKFVSKDDFLDAIEELIPLVQGDN